MKTYTQNITHAQFLGLVYHDLFGYPLTGDELLFWKIGTRVRPLHRVVRTGPFFHLPGRQHLIFTRGSGHRASLQKWPIAQKAAGILSLVPTIKFVGVSGALSMGAAGQADDIDLFIITSVDCLWITRLVSYLALKVFGLKIRKVGEVQVKDKLCLNLWLDERSLSFASRQDVYTAHEIMQVKPLVYKDKSYERFLSANRWIVKFFPSAEELLKDKQGDYPVDRGKLFSFLNKPAYRLQAHYMRQKRTVEQVSPGRALFHPRQLVRIVPQMFLARLEKRTFSNRPLTNEISLH